MHGTQLKRYYRNVDIDEVERPLDFVLNRHTALPMYNSTLRKLMIDRSTASVVMTTMETPEDFLFGLPMTKKIFVTPLPETPFVFGLAVRWVEKVNRGFPVPKYDTSKVWLQGVSRDADIRVLNPKFRNPAKSCELDATLHFGAMLSPLNFCKFRKNLFGIFMGDPLCALRNVINDKKLLEDNECDQDHIARIIMDAKATENIYEYWRRMDKHPYISQFDIQQVFSVHQSGFLRYFNFSKPTYEGFLEEVNKGAEGPLYRSTVLQATFYENMKMLVFRPPAKQIFRNFLEENISVPMVVSGVISNPASEAVAMGIAGLQFSYQKLKEVFSTLISDCYSSECLKPDEPGLQYFLTTTAGQIILTSTEEKVVSQNIKELDCALMEALVAAKIMTEHEIYDFQAICIEAVTPELNFALRLFSPIAFILKCIGHALEEVLIALTTWLLSFAAAQVWESPTPVHFEHVQSPSDNSAFAYRDKDNQFGYAHQKEADFSLPNQVEEDPFYRDYEVLKPFESPQNFLTTEPPTYSSPAMEVSDPTVDDVATLNPELPLFYETSQFYSQKNYNFEDPEDPWLMQKQAFSELNLCFANEPPENTSNLSPNLTSSFLPFNDTYKTIDLTHVMTTGEPVQILSDNVTLINGTLELNTSKAKVISSHKANTIPGKLLKCVQRIVQMRCHAAVHSSTQIGREACEVICDAVRQRMPQLTAFLHDCRQPLDSCTQRHSVFYLNKTVHSKREQQTSFGYGSARRGGEAGVSFQVHSGTFCQDCGNIDWAVASIPNTNLLLIATMKSEGNPSINCNCECKRRYRYGAQLKGDKSVPRPQTYRRDPVTPKTCEMISYKIENLTTCLSGSHIRSPGQLVGLALIILTLLLRLI